MFFEGNRRMEEGDATGAEQCFRQALALCPDFAEALTNLGLLRERAEALEGGGDLLSAVHCVATG
jgi:Flp pilus assembly protein TadD